MSFKGKLFGNRSKNNSPAQKDNPYAQPTASPDPYAANPPPAYQNAPNGGGRDQWRQEKSPVPPGGYGAGGASYGQNQGYGGASSYGAPPARSGGYGGFAPVDGDAANNRQALFGDRPQRPQPQQQNSALSQGSAGSGGYGGGGYGDSQGYGGGAGGAGGYGSYADRQLTEEEQEEEDVQAAKNEIKFIKQQDVSSTRNALRLAQQAEESGRATLSRLNEQGERIHNTERNLDLAASQNRIAEEKARELKTLNKSMFAVHVANPFTATKRRDERDAAVMDTHRREREERDNTRAAAWSSKARKDAQGRELRGDGPAGGRRNLAERSKYQFEADSEDDAMEDEIDSNLDALHGAAGRLKGLGQAMGREVDAQNKHIDRITGKTDKVDDQIAMNRARLDRIK